MKKYISYVAIILIIATAVFGALHAVSGSWTRGSEEAEVEDKKTTMHYVPVTRYFSSIDNVGKDDLMELAQSGDLFFESGEKESIVSILGDGFSDVPEMLDTNSGLVGNKVALVKWSSVNSGVKSLPFEGVLLWEAGRDLEYGLSAEVAGEYEEYSPENVTELVFGGDVMLSRTVATKIRALGELAPWEGVVDFLKGADISFLNLEVPLSDLYPTPTSGMSFIAPTKYVGGLTYSGVDVVSVANNHSANFGRAVFEDNLNTLSESKIEACGGGMNDAEVRTVNVIEERGIKFGFLCYNSIIGGMVSTDKSSGVATVEIEPWYRDSEIDIKKVEEDIRSAKEEVDFLIISPHWGVEYKHYPNDSQKEVARRMIDAGADLIVGTHPHVVQGSEYYKGKYITYSLGNFIFDQEWSLPTKQGAVLKTYVYNTKQVSAQLYPIEISNYHKPNFLSGNKKEDVLETILKESIGLY